jgi:tetratricopeptide (TPR) repeat protein
MILIFLQLLTIDSSIEAYLSGKTDKAYSIVYSIDDTTGFYQDELIEYRAFFSMHTGRFVQADSLFDIVIQSEYDSIRRKAYTNYAESKHLQFQFSKRLEYLKKAYEIEPTNQLIRIIARHYFQIEANYIEAQKWIDMHPITDEAGYYILRGEFSESKRRFKQAMEHYEKAQNLAQEAGIFNYELFASKGKYRAERLVRANRTERVKYWLEKVILIVIVYFFIKYKTRERTNDSPC